MSCKHKETYYTSSGERCRNFECGKRLDIEKTLKRIKKRAKKSG